MRQETHIAEVEDAATVILVRDGDEGPEVYMTRRQDHLLFLGGYHVFPGGKVDPEDRSEKLVSRCRCPVGSPPETRMRGAGETERAISFFSAAARELFEEAGVLVAEDEVGNYLDFPEDGLLSELYEYRKRVQEDSVRLHHVLEGLGLYLSVPRILWFAHWITPSTSPRRFNTHFFIARLPRGQKTSLFEEEVSEAVWIRPRDAIELWRQGRWRMIPPTIASLDTLSRYGSWSELKEVFSKPPEDHERTVWKGF